MSTKLSTIARNCEPKTPRGLEAVIHVANATEVSAIPAATDKVISTDITFTSTNGFHKWDTSLVLSKNTWQVENIGDADSPAYRTTINVFVGGITSSKTNILEAMAGCGAIVLALDKAGTVRLVGDINTPAFITFTENNSGDTNGYNVVITWESGYVPHFYTGAITADA